MLEISREQQRDCDEAVVGRGWRGGGCGGRDGGALVAWRYVGSVAFSVGRLGDGGGAKQGR